QDRPQRTGLRRRELGQRLTVPPSLDDEFAGVGEGPGMVADEPEAVIQNDPARCRPIAGDLGAGGAGEMLSLGAHTSRAILSFRIHTFVAKKSRIMAT